MSEGGDDDKLTPASADDPEVIQETAEDARAYLSQGAQQDLIQIEALMSSYQKIDVETFPSLALDQAQTRVLEDQRSDVLSSDPATEKAIKALSDKLEAVLQKNAADKPSRLSNVMKWLSIGGMALVTGTGMVGLVFEVIARFAHKQTADAVPVLTDTQKQLFQSAVSSWGEIPDAQYWTDLHDFAEANNATTADLIFFMQYTQQVFPLQKPYLWPHLADKLNLANAFCAKAQEAGNDPLAIVEALESPQKDSGGTILPRSMAASCAVLALGWLAIPDSLMAKG